MEERGEIRTRRELWHQSRRTQNFSDSEIVESTLNELLNNVIIDKDNISIMGLIQNPVKHLRWSAYSHQCIFSLCLHSVREVHEHSS